MWKNIMTGSLPLGGHCTSSIQASGDIKDRNEITKSVKNVAPASYFVQPGRFSWRVVDMKRITNTAKDAASVQENVGLVRF